MQNNPIIKNDPTGHKEIDAGDCGEKLKKSPTNPPCTDQRDLTNWMARVLVDSAKNPMIKQIAESNKNGRPIRAMKDFVGVVKNNAYFDVKWNVQAEVGETIKLGNGWYEFSATGNILYGFYGSAAGFSPDMLYRGAGDAQVWDQVLYMLGKSEHPEYHTDPGPVLPPFYGDTVDDHYAVAIGINLFEQYQQSGSLTTSEFTATIDSNPNKHKMSPRNAPSDCQPASGNYPTDFFYNK